MKVTNIPQVEIDRIYKSFTVFNISPDYQLLICDAIESLNNGDYIFDGATGEQEWWPTIYEPAALVHDYLWRTGMGGITSDRLFFNLMVRYRMPSICRTYRYYFVRLGWLFYYYWSYKLSNRLRPIKLKYKKLIQ